jgi:O-acetyl-ADP-ribose deacetylase (regulator of RNase III)
VILVVRGDLASVAADAVVRPADATLAPVSTASRLLDEAAGPSFSKAIARQRDLAVGSAVVTSGGDISAEFAIHVIVGATEQDATGDALRRSLDATLWHCTQWHIAALAMPALGDGLGPVPAGEVMQVILETLRGPMRNPEYPATVLIVAATETEQERYMARLPIQEGT